MRRTAATWKVPVRTRRRTAAPGGGRDARLARAFVWCRWDRVWTLMIAPLVAYAARVNELAIPRL